MKFVCGLAALAAAVVMSGGDARASFVTAAGQVTAGAGTSMSLSSVAVGGPTGQPVSFTLTVTQQGSPFSVVVNPLGGGQGAGTDDEQIYNVTITNNTLTPIQNVDVLLGVTPLMAASVLEFPGFGSAPGTATGYTFAPSIPGGIRVGGLGGGVFIMPGNSGVISFIVDSRRGNAAGRYTLTFTANPEPTSLALGGLALACVLGGTRLRRRQEPVQAA
jgi:hypothetical protein